MTEILFISAILLILFAYFGYPLTLLGLAVVRGRTVMRSDITPSVAVIIAAHNEEAKIEAKIENTLLMEYPRDKVQIIVVSDGSTDGTNRIVRRYAERGVQLVETDGRVGKEGAQRRALPHVKGEIVVFTDTATLSDTRCLKNMVRNFADETVGCVSSEDRIIKNGGEVGGEGFYVRYEMWLRTLESRVGSVVGLSGSLFAVRSSLCRDFCDDQQSDFRTVLVCIRQGLRGISDPSVAGFYRDVSKESDEFDRKVRTMVRALTVFFKNADVLAIWRYGIASYELLCHKLLRWIVPWLLVTAFVSNAILAFQSLLYLVLFIMQLAFYLGAVARIRNRRNKNSFLRMAAYFVRVNLSIAIAWLQYIRGRRIMTWEPTRR
jgi:cellulose synthase/poly-beta-1,6-N-acetylglucosamine synthase-like glycosyltransferase